MTTNKFKKSVVEEIEDPLDEAFRSENYEMVEELLNKALDKALEFERGRVVEIIKKHKPFVDLTKDLAERKKCYYELDKYKQSLTDILQKLRGM